MLVFACMVILVYHAFFGCWQVTLSFFDVFGLSPSILMGLTCNYIISLRIAFSPFPRTTSSRQGSPLNLHMVFPCLSSTLSGSSFSPGFHPPAAWKKHPQDGFLPASVGHMDPQNGNGKTVNSIWRYNGFYTC